MKPIVALMITGLLASGAVLAQDSKMAAPAPAASAPSTAAPTGDQPAKKSAHHKRKHKAAIAKLFERNDQVLDAEEVYALAPSI